MMLNPTTYQSNMNLNQLPAEPSQPPTSPLRRTKSLKPRLRTPPPVRRGSTKSKKSVRSQAKSPPVSRRGSQKNGRKPPRMSEESNEYAKARVERKSRDLNRRDTQDTGHGTSPSSNSRNSNRSDNRMKPQDGIGIPPPNFNYQEYNPRQQQEKMYQQFQNFQNQQYLNQQCGRYSQSPQEQSPIYPGDDRLNVQSQFFIDHGGF